jgi:hypothetical protein
MKKKIYIAIDFPNFIPSFLIFQKIYFEKSFPIFVLVKNKVIYLIGFLKVLIVAFK